VVGTSRRIPVEVAVVAFLVGRELTVVLVIALLAAGGSQLPKLVRALGHSSEASRPRPTDQQEPDSPEIDPRPPGS
jgi:Sec-independent protein translocase protein TatA